MTRGDHPTPPARPTRRASARPSQPPQRQPARRTPLPRPEARTVTLDGALIAYTLRVSARAHRLSLRVAPTADGPQVEVVVPQGASSSGEGARVARAEAFLREKGDWLRRTLARMRHIAPAAVLPPLASGRTLPCAGEQITVALATGAPAGRFRAALANGTLTLTVPTLDQATIRAALEAWYRRRARTIFAERLAACNTFGFRYGRVSIKEQKSRWGSCSRAGNLNFNWRLLLAPLPVLEYVVVHELAHLREANHGPRFWALVESVCPDHRAHRRWLRLHSHELRF